MGHAVRLEALGPALERRPARHTEGRGRDLAGSALLGHYRVPVEEGDVRARVPHLVGIEEMVGRDVVLVDRLLHQPQAEHRGVERDVAGRVGGHRGDVMQSTQIHCLSPLCKVR